MKKIRTFFMNIPLKAVYILTILGCSAGAVIAWFGFSSVKNGAQFLPGLFYMFLVPFGIAVTAAVFIAFNRRLHCPFCKMRLVPSFSRRRHGSIPLSTFSVRHCPNCGKPVYPKDYEEDFGADKEEKL